MCSYDTTSTTITATATDASTTTTATAALLQLFPIVRLFYRCPELCSCHRMPRPIHALLCGRTAVLGAALKEMHRTAIASADASHLVTVQFLFYFVVVTFHQIANLIQQIV
jgi:hypothetical protein